MSSTSAAVDDTPGGGHMSHGFRLCPNSPAISFQPCYFFIRVRIVWFTTDGWAAFQIPRLKLHVCNNTLPVCVCVFCVLGPWRWCCRRFLLDSAVWLTGWAWWPTPLWRSCWNRETLSASASSPSPSSPCSMGSDSSYNLSILPYNHILKTSPVFLPWSLSITSVVCVCVCVWLGFLYGVMVIMWYTTLTNGPLLSNFV